MTGLPLYERAVHLDLGGGGGQRSADDARSTADHPSNLTILQFQRKYYTILRRVHISSFKNAFTRKKPQNSSWNG